MLALLQSFVFIVIGTLMLIVAGPIAKTWPIEPAIGIGGLTSVVMLLLTLAFARYCRCPQARAALIPNAGTAARIIVGCCIGAGLVLANTLLMGMTHHVHWIANSSMPLRTIVLMEVGFVLLAAREELAFRGFPTFKLACDLHPWAAQLFVAALFCAEHLLGGAGWVQATIGAGLGSLVFGAAALRSQGLALPIAIHATWNIGDWARGGKLQPGLWQPVIDTGYEPSVALLGMGSYAVLMLLTLALLTKRRTRRSE